LTTLAIVLGCHVCVGKEDTIYKYPHSDDVTLSNKEIVEQTVTIARMLGREPMTGPEYRNALGMKPL
jgi:3-keto-5-aminohexanoate cleavage enzyme